ncbi:MAG TPA: hypothetical protein VHY34_03355 [Caulobacteraceae bacterium]|nr:hypothetical protein [Caulobacteraceae bacterium]
MERRGDPRPRHGIARRRWAGPGGVIAVDPVVLRPLLAHLAPAMVGLKAGRWRNILSLTNAALAHVGIVVIQGRIAAPPSPAWTAILGHLETGPGRNFHLWRFARYCTQMGIEPEAVSDAVLATYQRDLETRSLVSQPARGAREAARCWNEAVSTLPDWPQQRLAAPDNRRSFAPPGRHFPKACVATSMPGANGRAAPTRSMSGPFQPDARPRWRPAGGRSSRISAP